MRTLFILLIFSLLGCKPEADPDPMLTRSNDLVVNISHLANDSDIVFRNAIYQLEAGTQVKISRLAYILSNFYLINNDNERITLDSQYALIDAKRGQTEFTLQGIPEGSYKAIGFSLGLDSVINHSDPNTYPVDHPLSSVNNALHWDWTSGYIFIGIEGVLANDSANYVYHVAGDYNRIDYKLTTEFSKSSQQLNARLSFTFEEVFKNPNTFDMISDGMTIHTEYGAVSQALVENMVDVFAIISID